MLITSDRETINSLAEKWRVKPDIHPDDFIFRFLYDNPSFTSKDAAIQYYFNDGQKSTLQLATILKDICKYDEQGKINLLEFASGYGCLTRHMQNVLPFVDVTACDIHPEARDFVEKKLNTKALLSASQPEKLVIPERFDVIFALSFFSHMPKTSFSRWLRQLLSYVKPGGYLIFTTHGVESQKMLPNVQFDNEGFWFQSASEQKDLVTSEYGLACTRPEYVLSQLFDEPQNRLLYFQEAYWWGHQDVYVIKKDSQTKSTKMGMRARRIKNLITNKVKKAINLRDQKKVPKIIGQDNTFVVFQNKGYCYCCGQNTQFIAHSDWLRDNYKCDNCGSIPRERAVMFCIEKFFPGWKDKIIHESSPVARGTSLRLKNEAKNYFATQYIPGVSRGELHQGFANENLEQLTFDDQSIDLHVTQDVFEHIYNPAHAFREIARTLKPGGAHIFTTPLVNKTLPTKWCARLREDGTVEHLIDPPEYHGNPVSVEGSLVTVHWGYDIVKYIFDSSGLFTEVIYIDALELGIRAEFIEVLVTRK